MEETGEVKWQDGMKREFRRRSRTVAGASGEVEVFEIWSLGVELRGGCKNSIPYPKRTLVGQVR
eukprot:764889-Hanusia_phi.AAC.7